MFAAIFLCCFYENILKLINILTIVYLSAYKNFAFQLENERRPVETLLLFNVFQRFNFYRKIRF